MLTHNSYFDGQVHSIGFARNGRTATVGVMTAGTHHFGTQAPERISIVSGLVMVRLEGSTSSLHYPAGTSFEVPGDSSFDITAVDGPAAYHCEYL